MNIDLNKLNQLYTAGENIIDYLVSNGCDKRKAIAISYDIQAGLYIEYANNNMPIVNEYTDQISIIINNLHVEYGSIMEAGVGEATTFSHVCSKINETNVKAIGFDASLSRILYAKEYFAANGKGDFITFVADMFKIPLQDNSVDIVYTSHSMEPNGGYEKDLLLELYRVARKYLILFEPSYEFANQESKLRMDRFGYVKNIYNHIKDLNMNVLEHRLLDKSPKPDNQTAVSIIEKDKNATSNNKVEYCCPLTKNKLEHVHECYWSNLSLMAYPVINNVPCLLEEKGIIAAHFEKFI